MGNWLAICFTTEGAGDRERGGGFTLKLCCLGSVGRGWTRRNRGRGWNVRHGRTGCFFTGGTGGVGVGGNDCVTAGGTVLVLAERQGHKWGAWGGRGQGREEEVGALEELSAYHVGCDESSVEEVGD